jgi:maltose alpha-D-glucosyltransferase/alpha-amylase
MSLLLSLAGTPVLYYGDEIGMGDDISLADRDGVRTPMQWNSGHNAGFSKAAPQSLYLPVVADPPFDYKMVNVEAQEDDPHSLLTWLKQMIRRRSRHLVFGRGSIRFLEPANTHVLVYLREGEGETILVLANLSEQAQSVELDLSAFSGFHLVDVIGTARLPVIDERLYSLSLDPYATLWLSIDANQGDK